MDLLGGKVQPLDPFMQATVYCMISNRQEKGNG